MVSQRVATPLTLNAEALSAFDGEGRLVAGAPKLIHGAEAPKKFPVALFCADIIGTSDARKVQRRERG